MTLVAQDLVRAAAAAPRVFVGELRGRIGQAVTVCGWFVGQRRAGDLRFLTVRDRTGTVQVVLRGAELDALTPESAVRVTGTAAETPGGRFGGVEVRAADVEVLSAAATPLPLDGAADPEARLDHRHLDLRAPERSLIFQVQTTLLAAMRGWLLERGYLEIHTPKITGGGSESGASVFRLPYFGESACLAQSSQFYSQLAMAGGFDRVFDVGPVFRAEATETHRHATEFTCIDVELSWIDSHEALMAVEEALITNALVAVRQAHGRDIERWWGVEVEVPEAPIPRIPYEEAVALAGDAQGEDAGRITHRAEQALSKHVRERHGHSFVFVTGFPVDERPFYTMREDVPEDGAPPATRSFDLIWRGMEITSGCQREHRYERLLAQAAAGFDPEVMSRYLEPYYFPMFRCGCPPHGGFGIGLNRFLMALLGQPSIRETSFVFRGPGRFRP